MNNILEFFKGVGLNEILVYLINGYVFNSVFEFITRTDFKKEYQHIFVKSIVYGYIIVQIYNLLPIPIQNPSINIGLQICFCLVVGYILGRICLSSIFSRISRILGVYRNFNHGIWMDIFNGGRSPIWIRATIKSQNEDIWGELKHLETKQRYPLLVLRRYSIDDLDGNHIKDLSNDESRTILIDTAKCDRLEIVHTRDDKGRLQVEVEE